MDSSVRIAKELIRIAKLLVADEFFECEYCNSAFSMKEIEDRETCPCCGGDLDKKNGKKIEFTGTHYMTCPYCRTLNKSNKPTGRCKACGGDIVFPVNSPTTPPPAKKTECAYCGTEMSSDQQVCPACGGEPIYFDEEAWGNGHPEKSSVYETKEMTKKFMDEYGK